MKTITFKNGETMQIKNAEANTLRDNIINGCNNFQCFSDGDELAFMINLSEVAFIA